MKKVLVTGGCGYIGSHTIVDLIDHGFEVICADNLSNASEEALAGVAAITGVQVPNYRVDLSDLTATRALFVAHPDLAGIIHFAAFKQVGESVQKPLEYYRNNLNSLLNVLTCMRESGLDKLIFSSSCSVYGNSTELPVTEDTPRQVAESPYAATKQMGEDILADFARRYTDTSTVLLRYFNPAGAHESALLGEAPSNPAASLVPVITETAIGKRASLTVFGDDYDTRDGSCVRDYIHVMDLANAHTKALSYLLEGRQASNLEVFNLGIGAGVTVLEAVRAFIEVTGQPLAYTIGPRRAGDVVAVYANLDKAKRRLLWSPSRDINDIMRTAWAWEQRRSAVPS